MALTPDQEKLKEAALAARRAWRHTKARIDYEIAANPAAILAILAQLEQVQGWVSVDTRLPEGDEAVLAIWKDGKLADNLVQTMVTNVAYLLKNPENFTHWRKLPPPPEAA